MRSKIMEWWPSPMRLNTETTSSKSYGKELEFSPHCGFSNHHIHSIWNNPFMDVGARALISAVMHENCKLTALLQVLHDLHIHTNPCLIYTHSPGMNRATPLVHKRLNRVIWDVIRFRCILTLRSAQQIRRISKQSAIKFVPCELIRLVAEML